MNRQQQLAARRQLLVASATLQRVRLAREVGFMRSAWSAPRWAGWFGVGAAAAAATWALARAHRGEPTVGRSASSASRAPSVSWPFWAALALRLLRLWRTRDRPSPN